MGQQIGSFFKSKYTGQQIENMLDSATNIADQYDPAASYVVGDLVLYNNGLYVCTGATTGTFDPTKWTATSLFEILNGLASSYTDPNSDGNVVIGVDSTVGEKILRSLTFPGLTNRYYLPFAQYIRTQLANDPSSASFGIEIPDAEEAPMHSTKIKGKTVAVNQLISNGNFADTSNWGASGGSAFTVSGNVASFTAAAQYAYLNHSQFSLVSGHVYFLTVDLKSNGGNSSVKVYCGAGYSGGTTTIGTSWQTVSFVQAANQTGNYNLLIQNNDASDWKTIDVRNVMGIDLTTIFSAADLATIGTSVDTFKTVFLKRKGYPLPQYIPYDAGSLANVNGEYRVCGRNLWDEEWELGMYSSATGATYPSNSNIRSINRMRVNENTQYFFTRTENAVAVVLFYDAEDNFIEALNIQSATSFTTPSACAYIRFYMGQVYGTTYKNDVCISDENGAYEKAYNGGTIDCSTAPLNGVGTAQDEVDYATGTRTTRCGMVDLGTLDWIYDTGCQKFRVTFTDAVRDPNANVSIDNGVCSNYVKVSDSVLNGNTVDKVFAIYLRGTTTTLYIRDNAYTDAAAFKTAMNGVYLCYELATPTTTTETPQPVETQYGYNVFEPVSGGVQSAEVDTTYYENIAGYIDKKLAEG